MGTPPRHVLLFAALLLAAAAVSGCASDDWLREANPSGNSFFDFSLATEVRSFWYVSESQLDAAAQLLEVRAVVPVSPESAAPLIGQVPRVPAGESLYLIRAIDVGKPKSIHVYQLGSWVQANAEGSSCAVFGPSIRRQPLVIAVARAPTRLRLSYSCAG